MRQGRWTAIAGRLGAMARRGGPRLHPRHHLLPLLALLAILLAAAAWLATSRWQMDALRRAADESLSLKSHNVVTQVERFRPLPFVLAQDDRIRRLLRSPDDPTLAYEADRYLALVADATGSDVLYVMDAKGLTLAASNAAFLRQSYGFRPYFQDALAAGSGRYYGVGVTTGKPGYFLAARVDGEGEALGVVAVKVDMTPLERAWAEAGESVGLVDRAGMIFLSSEFDWSLRPFAPLSPADRVRMQQERQYPPEALKRPPLLAIDPALASGDVYLSSAEGETVIRVLDIPSDGWRIFDATEVAPVRVAAGLAAALVLLAAMLLLTAALSLRTRRHRRQTVELRGILENMSVGIAVFDPALRLLAWNSGYARLNSYPDALIRRGRPFADILRHNIARGDYGQGDPDQQLQERLERARQGTARQIEVRRPDGTWVEIKRTRMPGGQLIHTYSDITERKATEAELASHRHNLQQLVAQRTTELQAALAEAAAAQRRAEEASRAKTKFLNAVNHDIRNPLNGILGYAGLVLENAGDRLPPQQAANLEKMTALGRELLELVQGFIDYTREDRIETSSFALGPLVEECLSTIEPRIARRPVQASAALPADLPMLLQDRAKLGRVLRNLLINATKFTDSGAITVTAAVRGAMIEIAVADTGIGIAAEHLERIFEEFARVEPEGERRREGTGLGLAICRQFVTRMGGTLAVTSRPGSGSVFTVSIPIRHPLAGPGGDADAAANPRDPGAIPGVAPRRPRLLVVDDAATNRDYLAQRLDAGYELLFAADGAEAVEIAGRERPDLILMDLWMPVMDGWEATRRLKQDPVLRAIPVIAMTANVVDRETIAALGCEGFLAKPLDETLLFGMLGRLLAAKGDTWE
jgi:histidine kinase